MKNIKIIPLFFAVIAAAFSAPVTPPSGPKTGPPGSDGTGLTSPANWRNLLGGTTVGQNLFTLPNPGAVTFPRINANNSVSLRTASELKTDLALDQVNNTSDLNKPISTNTQTALNNRVEWVSVINYGAVGNGIADDTAAFQAAADTGKNVYIPTPPVEYKLTAKVNIRQVGSNPGVPILKGQKFFGDGPTKSIIYQSNSAAHIFDITQTAAFYLQFDGLGLKGTGGNSSLGYGIATSGGGPHNSWQITNCYFYWLNKGIGAGIEDTLISNCTFDSCVVGIDMMTAGGAAINQNTIDNCILVYQTGSKYPTVPGIGIRVNGGQGHKIRGLDLGNAGMVTGIELNGNSSGSISGVSTEMFPYTGQLVSVLNGTNAGISNWTMSDSAHIGFGVMNAGDYPIVQGRYVALTLSNVTVSGTWTAGTVKRTAANELNAAPLEVLGKPLRIDIYSGANLLDSYWGSPINENSTAVIPAAGSGNKGRYLTRSGVGGGDDEFFRSTQLAGGGYSWENLLQYGTDDRAGKFSSLGWVAQSVAGVTASADSSYLTNTPDRVLDANTGTEWWHLGAVNTGSPFLKFDFGVGNAPRIGRISFHNTTVAILNVTVAVSNDNSTWTTVGYFRKTAVGATTHLINPAAGFRYYRLSFASPSTDSTWLQVAEVGFWRSVVTGELVGSGAGITDVPLASVTGMGASIPGALAIAAGSPGAVQLNNGSGMGLTALNAPALSGTITGNPITGSTGSFTTLDASGTTTLNGSTVLGDAVGDNISFVGRVITNFNPNVTDTRDFGTNTLRWRDAWFSRNVAVGGNLTVSGLVIDSGIVTYANDAAADADSSLPSKGFYKVTGSRVVYQKP